MSTPASAPRSARRDLQTKKLLQWTLALWLIILLLVALAAIPLTVFPASVAVPRDTDVVIVLARGGGEQLDAARALMDRAVGPPAELLLIANGASVSWPDSESLCGTSTQEYTVACFVPEPDTPAGEARAVAALVDREGWEDIAIVTTTSQATRARRLVERCVGDAARVQVVTAQSGSDLVARVQESVRGLGDIVREGLGDTGC